MNNARMGTGNFSQLNSNPLMPSLFLSHGAPTLLIDDSPTHNFYIDLEPHLPRPSAILIISAHWVSETVKILGGNQPLDTIYDFYGFPQTLYEMTYPAPGIANLSTKIAAKLDAAGFKVSIDTQRGLDHGAWVPLKLMYPDADIPVAQIAVNMHQSAEYHWRLGRALADLTREGVLIIGSGTMTHNLGEIADFHNGVDNRTEADYVKAFSRWMEEKIDNDDIEALLQYRSLAPYAVRAHPTAEHILPFYVALGAAGDAWRGELLHRSCSYGVINLDCYAFTPRTLGD